MTTLLLNFPEQFDTVRSFASPMHFMGHVLYFIRGDFMAFFSHGESRQKLMLLYFLKELDFEITRNELFRVFAQQGWMEYFDFQNMLTQLEEDAFVAAVPCAFGHGYRITPHGESTLAMFCEQLPYSVRENLRAYVAAHGASLREQTQFSSTTTQMPDGSYLAILRLMDKNSQILNISLQLPTAQLAQAACENWSEQAGPIYQELLKKLF